MITRRRLLSLMGAGGAFERLGLMNALAQGGSSYKALVCVFLYGGNDGNNTIVPISTPLQNYTQYAAGRAGLALSQAALLPIGITCTMCGGGYALLIGFATAFAPK